MLGDITGRYPILPLGTAMIRSAEADISRNTELCLGSDSSHRALLHHHELFPFSFLQARSLSAPHIDSSCVVSRRPDSRPHQSRANSICSRCYCLCLRLSSFGSALLKCREQVSATSLYLRQRINRTVIPNPHRKWFGQDWLTLAFWVRSRKRTSLN